MRVSNYLWLHQVLMCCLLASAGQLTSLAQATKPADPGKAAVVTAAAAKAENEAAAAPAQGVENEGEDEEKAAEKKEAKDTIKVARPVSSDPVQVFGWMEKVRIGDTADLMVAKLDTGATTSSLHAEDQQIFEKDGKKWVKFILTDPNEVGAKRYEMEAPLARTVMIKEPGAESVRRNVVRLSFKIGERNIKAEFTLNNRHNMSCPVLIGRKTLQILGWVDASRTYLADDKIFR